MTETGGIRPSRLPGPASPAVAGPETAGPQTAGPGPAVTMRPARRRLAGQLVLLAGYLTAGIGVTWPRVTDLTDGTLPLNRDVASYVWGLWWVAHQVVHLGDPWFTRFMAAPYGIQLGFDTLMPLPGLVLTPVTLAFGPSAAFSLLTIVMPGLLCYVMYRAARLWLGPVGAIAAGAFFGLSGMLAWQDWYHVNIAVGTLFLPLTLETAVRLGRSPSWRRGLALGLVIGAAVLTNQESAVMATMLALAILVLPAIREAAAGRDAARLAARLAAGGTAVAVAVIVASPQLVAMIVQATQGGAATSAKALANTYEMYGAGLPTLFAPSPRLAYWHAGLNSLASAYTYGQPNEALATYGIVLTAAALAGLALTWRRRSMWWLALLWVGGAALALGTKLMVGRRTDVPLAATWHGVIVSRLLPYTWLVRIPGLAALREADRLALLGLVGAAVLAGAAVEWLSRHARPAIGIVAIAGLLEAGWSGAGPVMPTTMPTLDAPIAADHSGSIVVDVPFGLRGGIPLRGVSISPNALMLATADGHPRAISYTSWVPQPTSRAVLGRQVFYHCLDRSQFGRPGLCGRPQVAAARRDLRTLGVGWVLVWPSKLTRPATSDYLRSTGFHLAYRADGVSVWRPGPLRRPRR
jgi:hypothetical protein